jgi:choline-sulfatase
MVRRGPHKFIACPTDPDQLYDLQADPHEVHNLAGQAAYAALQAEFQQEVQQRWDVVALRSQVIASQRQRHLVAQALATGRSTGWDFQPHTDATHQYVRTHKEFWELLRQARYPAVPASQPVREVKRYRKATGAGSS